MSLFLYRWGGFVRRHAWWVVVAWVVLLVGTVLAVGATGRHYDDTFTIPGSPSQDGMSVLTSRFPQAAGASAQIVFTAPEGASIATEPYASQVEQVVSAAQSSPQVASVSDPLSGSGSAVISADGRSALSQVQFTVANIDVEQSSLDALEKAAQPTGASTGMTTLVGGTAYAPPSEHSSLADVIGIVAAFLVLLITFGSFVAAGMPLATAIAGVVVTDCIIGVLSWLTPINSTAPTLALMIGLAVGIDYALFILSRHRRQLADGLAPDESIARALGTAGSAVVFAGATVIIALCGLAVANIPFLTVMGLCAAAGVAASVLVSLTLVPAVAALLGRRLTPRRRTRARRPRKSRMGVAERWVTVITRHPVVTVVSVVVGLGLLALPALGMSTSLADNGSAPAGSTERQTYDAVAEQFGPGYNAPLLVVGDVITSTDPRSDVTAFAADIADLPGVVAVGQATPNEGGDTALIQVIPDGPQSSPETIALVQRLRDDAPALAAEHHITDVQVTGQAAISIDVSARLSAALVPFGLVVVGLSLVLLAVVFRSILVPLKATAGYLLSIGVSFGVVTAVFNWGWGAALFGVQQTGPVISFLPIIVMGVLFGLAMDYEVFLVSRIREDYTRSNDAQGAIRRGFTASAPVVTAAGIIMVSVFTAFVPTGSATIKPIALALAVGVFIDAFVVRMTLVPAVLALLGRHAWWLPRWLARRLPALDIEGTAVEHAVSLRSVAGDPSLITRGLVVEGASADRALDLLVHDGEVAALSGLDADEQLALALTLAGRARAMTGEVSVGGMLLPEQASRVQRRVAVFDASAAEDTGSTVGDYVLERLRELSWTACASTGRVRDVVRRVDELLSIVSARGSGQHSHGPVTADTVLSALSAVQRFALECTLATRVDATLVVVVNLDRLPVSSQRRDVIDAARAAAAGGGIGVLLVSRDRVRETDDLGIGEAAVADLRSTRAAGTAASIAASAPKTEELELRS